LQWRVLTERIVDESCREGGRGNWIVSYLGIHRSGENKKLEEDREDMGESGKTT
jgi:hypothetical protein